MRWLLPLLFITSFSIAREEHPLSTIQGTQIDLKVYDHAFAGSIRDFVVWGALDEEQGRSELIMRRDGKIVRAYFAKHENKIGGVIRREVEGKTLETTLFFERLDKATNTYYIKINDAVVPIKVTSKEFMNNHFINPTYSGTVGTEAISFTLDGQACYGYSLHLILMIFGAFAG